MSSPARTTVAAVQAVLRAGADNSDWDGTTDLTPFVEAASMMVDRVATCSVRKMRNRQLDAALAPNELELIERWLAAHMYCQSDQQYQSRSTLSASGQFKGSAAMAFEATTYGQNALNMDWSGCLKSVHKQQRAFLFTGRQRKRWFGDGDTDDTLPANQGGDSADDGGTADVDEDGD